MIYLLGKIDRQVKYFEERLTFIHQFFNKLVCKVESTSVFQVE